MKSNTNFEFDSRCSDSRYVPSITAAIEKLDNSLLQQPDCTWAYLGNGKDGQEANRYLFWTSLNTDKVGAGKNIPVIIQTGDGKYYVSETKTGTRKGKNYVTVSKSLITQSQYKEILKKGEKFSSLEEAYDAYLKALDDPKYRTAANTAALSASGLTIGTGTNALTSSGLTATSASIGTLSISSAGKITNLASGTTGIVEDSGTDGY